MARKLKDRVVKKRKVVALVQTPAAFRPRNPRDWQTPMHHRGLASRAISLRDRCFTRQTGAGSAGSPPTYMSAPSSALPEFGRAPAWFEAR